MTVQMNKVSRTMSHALRHGPEVYSLTLSPAGFVEVSELAYALTAHFGSTVTVEMVQTIVAEDSKGRFTLSGSLIRAAQGHSFPVELGLVPSVPPAILFHGTVERFVSSIKSEGLIPGSRQFVHLSGTVEIAVEVGSRRGVPVILTVDTVAAVEAGVSFFQAENGVWLTSSVPAEFLTFPSK